MAVHISAELGINHRGSIEKALELVSLAHYSGADSVKLQKRTPELSVPRTYWQVPKETPWGAMSYLSYRHGMEFNRAEYDHIAQACEGLGIPWFASVWDIPSADFMAEYDPPCYKIGSPSCTDWGLISHVAGFGKPLIVSTGMTAFATVDALMEALYCHFPDLPVTVCQCTSIYPCPPEKLDVRVVTLYQQFRRRYGYRVGWSSHEVECGPTLAAVALGAEYVERHITDDRMAWGTDQRASLDGEGFRWMVQQVRRTELALEGGCKRVYPEEEEAAQKLRVVPELKIPEGAVK